MKNPNESPRDRGLIPSRSRQYPSSSTATSFSITSSMMSTPRATPLFGVVVVVLVVLFLLPVAYMGVTAWDGLEVSLYVQKHCLCPIRFNNCVCQAHPSLTYLRLPTINFVISSTIKGDIAFWNCFVLVVLLLDICGCYSYCLGRSPEVSLYV